VYWVRAEDRANRFPGMRFESCQKCYDEVYAKMGGGVRLIRHLKDNWWIDEQQRRMGR